MTQLSRECIIHAAGDILQTYGLQDLSIRKVASQLGVQPGALYWHFPNKQALLGAVCTHILSCDLPTRDNSLPPLHVTTPHTWAQEIVTVAEDLRNRALFFRDGSELMSTSLASQTSPFPQLDALTTILHTVSPTPELHARVLLLFILGALVDEQSRLQLAELTETQTPTSPSFETLEGGLNTLIKGLTVSSL